MTALTGYREVDGHPVEVAWRGRVGSFAIESVNLSLSQCQVGKEGGFTDKRLAVAIGKDMAHQNLRIDAAILILCTLGQQHGLVDLEIDQWSGCQRLFLILYTPPSDHGRT